MCWFQYDLIWTLNGNATTCARLRQLRRNPPTSNEFWKKRCYNTIGAGALGECDLVEKILGHWE